MKRISQNPRGFLRCLITYPLVSFLALALLLVYHTPAQEATTPRLDVPKTATLVPRVTAEPDDTSWADAAVISTLTISLGAATRPGIVPSTEIRLRWDPQFLYIRFLCADDDIYAPFDGRDQPLYKADVAEVFVDPAGDGRQFIELQLSPRGDVFRQLSLLTADAASGPDGVLLDEVVKRELWRFPNWDLPGLRTAARICQLGSGKPGWITDFALPAAPLLRRLGRREFSAGLTLRANLLRYDWQPSGNATSPLARTLVPVNWAPVRLGCPHLSPRAMGFLRLVR